MKLTEEQRKALRITVDYTNMTDKYLGDIGDKGISERKLDSYKKAAKEAHAYVSQNRGKDELFMGWTELPYNQNEIVADILATAKDIRKKFDNFVVLGIGGSALGPIMAFNALCHLHYNDLPRKKRGGPRFFVEDNVDPVRMKELLDVIDVKKTCFNVISKSGATSETMAQYLIISDLLKQAGVKIKDHVIFTTDAKRGNLVKIAKELGGVKKYILPDGVGGRFSELSPVGLLPAAVVGIDIKTLLKGAAYMDKLCKTPELDKNPALLSATLQYICMQEGKNIGVLMPYSDNLKYVSDWYAQLWAESLGKNMTRDGKPVSAGQTPVKALGVTDQHSQVQLYTEGPFDKVFTFLSVGSYKEKTPIPHGCEKIPDVSFLGGHTMEELIQAENKATAFALTKAGRMNYTINLPEVNEFTLGQLLYLFELQTAYAGAMLNIDTFNQPGVEAGKKATFALLGKPGYEAQKAELDQAASNPDYII
ncbi:MAG: glucose-6-phosphate isomerase [Clostridia bacterium]|nr:glucose-6-phosphate isomerase [Clostridia bacterium]